MFMRLARMLVRLRRMLMGSMVVALLVVLCSCMMCLGGLFVVLCCLPVMFFCHFVISPKKLYVG